jgi:hypothetical protein
VGETKIQDDADCDDSYDDPRDWYGAGDLGGWWIDTNADRACEFLLGTHIVSWAWNGRALGPLFIAQQRIAGRKSRFPVATVPVYIDSGGFTELDTHGHWTVSPRSYVDLVRRTSDEMQTLRWAAIQDWMCEDRIRAKTGLTVLEHQHRTIASYHELVALAPEVRWLPVVQGQTQEDYERHVEMYAESGVHLPTHRLVGVGSVCRRASSAEIHEVGRILAALVGRGLRLHGFGLKSDGLRLYGQWLRSADSMAWSSRGRHEVAAHWVSPDQLRLRLGLQPVKRESLQNSQRWAEEWRARMVATATGARMPVQETL